MYHNNFQEVMRDFSNEASLNKKEEKVVQVTPAQQTPTFSLGIFNTNINNICFVEEDTRYRYIDLYIFQILHNVFVSEKKWEYFSLFFNENFVNTFKKVLSEKIQNRQVSDNIIIYINNICYNLMILSDDKKPNNYSTIMNDILQIVEIANSARAPKLYSLGLPKNIVNYILCTRYSSFDDQIIVRRINFLLVNNLPEEIVTEKLLTDILSVLFFGTDTWIRVFQYYMIDVLPQSYDYGNNLVNRVINNDSVLNLAYLNCINNLTVPEIERVLQQYAGLMELSSSKPRRYSLKSLSNDYNCINQAIYNLSLMGIYVP